MVGRKSVLRGQKLLRFVIVDGRPRFRARRTPTAPYALALVGGVGLGAMLMFLADPDRGARRRALARDKAVHAIRRQRQFLGKSARDVAHRTSGIVARARHRKNGEVSNDVLVDRIRARLGRQCSHPGSIEVNATSEPGVVTLQGPILSSESERVLKAARRTPGVRHVNDELERHVSPGQVPGLQGPGHRVRKMPFRDNWAPAFRIAGAAAGIGLLGAGLLKRGWFGPVATVGGGLLALRSLTNLPVGRLVGIGVGARAIDIQKTMTIQAPDHEVWSFLTHPENFPQFMEHVRRVTVSSAGTRAHWEVEGPAGVTVRWDAEIVQSEPYEVFAWRTLPGSAVEHTGSIRLEQVDSESTRVHVRMSYNPPAGAIGHFVASLFRRDAKHELDDDLLRLKSLLERGKTIKNGRAVTREDLH